MAVRIILYITPIQNVYLSSNMVNAFHANRRMYKFLSYTSYVISKLTKIALELLNNAYGELRLHIINNTSNKNLINCIYNSNTMLVIMKIFNTITSSSSYTKFHIIKITK